MSEIRNFFENRLNFQQYDDNLMDDIEVIDDSKYYRSRLIPNPRAVGIYNSLDIYSELKSFFYYLIRGHISTVHEGYTYSESSFDIEIMINHGKDNSEVKKLITFRVERHCDVLDFGKINFARFDAHEFHACVPIVIDIDAVGYYDWDAMEGESEDESITLKAYKEDKCVVCLNNEPKILFYDCIHYCICFECEESKPFKNSHSY